MRGFSVALAILVAFLLVGTLVPAPALIANRSVALPLDDIRSGAVMDGELLRVLASMDAKGGVTHLPPVVVPVGTTLPGMVQKLAARVGQPLGASDVADFSSLDPRVAGPSTLLLVAIDQAWDLRDQSFARLTGAEQIELLGYLRCQCGGARFAALQSQVDMRPLINGAILLLDTLEGPVVPALQQAFANGAWPNASLADPVGVLNLGSVGNDFSYKYYIAMIDPAGHDMYRGNAGGTTIDLDLSHIQTPIAIAVDLDGNDTYANIDSTISPQGGGSLGVGILLNYGGNTSYSCPQRCAGSGTDGVGFQRTFGGNNTFRCGVICLGATQGAGLGMVRADQGNSTFYANSLGGGWGEADGLANLAFGILWIRAGNDAMSGGGIYANNWGYSEGLLHGWFVNEGTGNSYFGCLTCAPNTEWRAGVNPPPGEQPRGWGIDGRPGGLAQLIQEYADQQPSTTP